MNQKTINTLKGIFWGAVICAVISMCCGCTTTRYQTIPEIHEKYVYKTDTVQSHDSIYMHDSIMCVVRGDSIFTDRWHTKYIERLKYVSKSDTVCMRDSIAVPIEVIKTKTKTDYKGWFVAVALAAVIGIMIRRK